MKALDIVSSSRGGSPICWSVVRRHFLIPHRSRRSLFEADLTAGQGRCPFPAAASCETILGRSFPRCLQPSCQCPAPSAASSAFLQGVLPSCRVIGNRRGCFAFVQGILPSRRVFYPRAG